MEVTLALTVVWPCGVSCCLASMDALSGTPGPGNSGTVHEWVFAGCLLFHPMGNLGDPGELAREGTQKAELHRVASAARSDRIK